jgi:hypothetical protein
MAVVGDAQLVVLDAPGNAAYTSCCMMPSSIADSQHNIGLAGIDARSEQLQLQLRLQLSACV